MTTMPIQHPKITDADISELRKVCKIAFDKNLIDTHSGNISIGTEDGIIITKTGRSLIDLKPDDFVLVPSNAPFSSEASSELEIHKFILESFPNSTVFHSHPLNAITLSLCLDKINKKDKALNNELQFSNPVLKKIYKEYPDLDIITPIDFESAYFFPQIFVLPLKFIEDVKTKNKYNTDKNPFKFKAKDLFKENGVFVIKSHGAFSWGKTTLEALRWTMVLENSAKILLNIKNIKKIEK